ncbi:hypothetical protein ABB26_05870 [Stenotrophomonas humi]|uniref:DUF4124 domain-containing protein n=1 Tax=Stenotrophomonas humi TaxID=405444 RepID=A0A0R0CFH2_9GAMM|nr:DUF4124 domain-containing protein [Stenotrophomonas humi]KRG64878.1 hypothetical protein ABB26_05870 [Stenotrophomonas humi]
MRAFLIVLLLLLPASAFAQVYKCKGKSGETMYSENPCDARAEPMKLREHSVPTPVVAPAASTSEPTAGEEPGQASESASAAAANSELEANRAAERTCIANATASVYGPSNDRVSTLQQQMTMLGEQLANAPDAERSQALRTRMATFRQAITREHGNAHTQMTAARQRCLDMHRPAQTPAR